MSDGICNAYRNLKRVNLKFLFKNVIHCRLRLINRCCTSSSSSSRSFTINPNLVKKKFDLSKFDCSKIRNFCIIAHVDHGKSTLSDRLLELTGLIAKEEQVKQYLDKLQVEKERGITVKAQTVSLIHNYDGEDYLLNLIDTPGHVDFSYEVWRSLSACQGAVLVVDANSGVQAQTVAHFNHAFLADMTIVPVINKIDLKTANPEIVTEQLKKVFSIEPNEILKISAKSGLNVESVLDAIVERIPSPKFSVDKPFQALLFDSWYEQFKGVVILIAVQNGCIKIGDKFVSSLTKQCYEVKTIGFLHPNEVDTGVLYAGQVGYVTANIRHASEAIVGDILFLEGNESNQELSVRKIPEAKPMLFAGIFPCEQSEANNLKQALEKLLLTDASVTIKPDTSPALGFGFRLGFLGLLHMEVFCQRLEQEFDAATVITAPSVPYRVKIKGEKNIKEYGSEIITVTNPLKLPDTNIIVEYEEPMVNGTIITPEAYLSPLTKLCMERRGELRESFYIDQTRLMVQYKFPLSEVIVDFYDNLKSLSSGYASFDYEDAGYQSANLVRVDILLNGELLEELTTIVCVNKARTVGREICERLRETLPRQQFKIAIQAVINRKIIAREDVKAYRKDVKVKMLGDTSRYMKLLAKQKEGKERMRHIANIQVPRDIFIQVLKKK